MEDLLKQMASLQSDVQTLKTEVASLKAGQNPMFNMNTQPSIIFCKLFKYLNKV